MGLTPDKAANLRAMVVCYLLLLSNEKSQNKRVSELIINLVTSQVGNRESEMGESV